MTVDAALLAAVAGLVILLLNALITKLDASPNLKSVVAVVLAGVTAIGANVANVHGVVDLKSTLLVGLTALIAAAGHKWSWASGIEQVVAKKTANTGLGGSGNVVVVHGPNDPNFK